MDHARRTDDGEPPTFPVGGAGEFGEALPRRTGQYRMAARDGDVAGSVALELFYGRADGPRGIDDVIDQENVLAVDVADEGGALDGVDGGVVALFRQADEVCVQLRGVSACSFHSADIGCCDGVSGDAAGFEPACEAVAQVDVFETTANRVEHAGDGFVVDVYGDHAVCACFLQHSGEQACGDSLPDAAFALVLAGARKIREDGGDPLGIGQRRGFDGVEEHDEAVVGGAGVGGRDGRLKDVNVGTANVVVDDYLAFAARKPLLLNGHQRRAELVGDRGSEGMAGIAGHDVNRCAGMCVVHTVAGVPLCPSIIFRAMGRGCWVVPHGDFGCMGDRMLRNLGIVRRLVGVVLVVLGASGCRQNYSVIMGAQPADTAHYVIVRTKWTGKMKVFDCQSMPDSTEWDPTCKQVKMQSALGEVVEDAWLRTKRD